MVGTRLGEYLCPDVGEWTAEVSPSGLQTPAVLCPFGKLYSNRIKLYPGGCPSFLYTISTDCFSLQCGKRSVVSQSNTRSEGTNRQQFLAVLYQESENFFHISYLMQHAHQTCLLTGEKSSCFLFQYTILSCDDSFFFTHTIYYLFFGGGASTFLAISAFQNRFYHNPRLLKL